MDRIVKLDKNENKMLVCICCNRRNCEYVMKLVGNDYGVHNECADKYFPATTVKPAKDK